MATLPDGTEIPDTLVPQMQKAGLLDQLAADPKTRTALLKLVKEYKPEVRIPEIDQPREFDEQVVAPVRKELEDMRGELAKDRATAAREREQQRAIRAGLTEGDLPEVEKLMTEKKIGDWDTAVEHYSMSRRLGAPRSMPSPLELPAMDGLMANPAKWARNEAYKVVNELRSQR